MTAIRTEGSALRRLVSAFVDDLRPRDELDRRCYWIGAVLIASGLVHLVVFAVKGGPWLGPVSFRKAVTFGLSFGLTVLTMTAVLRLFGTRTRWQTRALVVFVGACVVEVVLVTMQAWRETPSHFNRETGFDSAVSTVLAAGGAAIVLTSIVLAVTLFRASGAADTIVQLGVRAGFVVFLSALAVGAAMIARGVSLQRAGNDYDADHHAGSLKPAHAAPMHAILVLPVIAWLLDRGDWANEQRRRLLWTAIGAYGVTVVAVLVESIAELDPLSVTNPVAIVSGLATLTIVGVGLVALRRALTVTA